MLLLGVASSKHFSVGGSVLLEVMDSAPVDSVPVLQGVGSIQSAGSEWVTGDTRSYLLFASEEAEERIRSPIPQLGPLFVFLLMLLCSET